MSGLIPNDAPLNADGMYDAFNRANLMCAEFTPEPMHIVENVANLLYDALITFMKADKHVKILNEALSTNSIVGSMQKNFPARTWRKIFLAYSIVWKPVAEKISQGASLDLQAKWASFLTLVKHFGFIILYLYAGPTKRQPVMYLRHAVSAYILANILNNKFAIKKSQPLHMLFAHAKYFFDLSGREYCTEQHEAAWRPIKYVIIMILNFSS